MDHLLFCFLGLPGSPGYYDSLRLLGSPDSPVLIGLLVHLVFLVHMIVYLTRLVLLIILVLVVVHLARWLPLV